MQPSPMAETSRLLFPSFLFFILVLDFADQCLRPDCGGTMSSPPFARRSSFPPLKGAKERIGVFKAQQEGGFIQFHRALFQIMAGKFAARIFNNLLKSEASVRKPALKRACAQAEFLGDILQRGALAGQ